MRRDSTNPVMVRFEFIDNGFKDRPFSSIFDFEPYVLDGGDD